MKLEKTKTSFREEVYIYWLELFYWLCGVERFITRVKAISFPKASIFSSYFWKYCMYQYKAIKLSPSFALCPPVVGLLTNNTHFKQLKTSNYTFNGEEKKAIKIHSDTVGDIFTVDLEMFSENSFYGTIMNIRKVAPMPMGNTIYVRINEIGLDNKKSKLETKKLIVSFLLENGTEKDWMHFNYLGNTIILEN